jgi:hypothetical protein
MRIALTELQARVAELEEELAAARERIADLSVDRV